MPTSVTNNYTLAPTMHRYFPHTRQEIDEMLARCGVKSLDDLYSDVPNELKLREPYKLQPPMSETEVRNFFSLIGRKNTEINACFAGGGFYQHQVPAAVLSIIGRSEFLTAYTPYQPEISQGTLQYIFEYQTMMSRLTELDVSNASMYDGATATAEAMMMAVAASRKRHTVLVSATLNPAVRAVVDTYARYHNVTLITVNAVDGITDLTHLETLLNENADVAGVILPTPNFYGIIEDFSGVAEMVHAHKALLIINCIAADLATLKSPGAWGADIACGDAQSLGLPLNFGGPYLGFICTTKSLMRKMPGRIVGATTDANGKRCFVLTLQAREQHIRREKATSNICSNQGLMTLFVTAYMALHGRIGLCEIAYRGHQMACYLLEKLVATGKARLKFPGNVDAFIEHCITTTGILPGIKVGDNGLLIAATEMQTRTNADCLVNTFEKFCCSTSNPRATQL
jgi:glycine dehydrogenase subunit 1